MSGSKVLGVLCNAVLVGSLVASATCCVYTFGTITTIGAGTPCGVGTTVVCETGFGNGSGGLYYQQGFRSAQCYQYKISKAEDAYVAECDTPAAPGYTKIPGSMSAGRCCFVKSTINPDISTQGFQVAKCKWNCVKED